jgi:hypothetical protein
MNTADILVIDDDPAICQIVQRMLSDEQCKVQTKQSVGDALLAIEQKAFDACDRLQIAGRFWTGRRGKDPVEMGCESNHSYLGL